MMTYVAYIYDRTSMNSS